MVLGIFFPMVVTWSELDCVINIKINFLNDR